MPRKQDEFEKLFMEAVDEGLKSLGESVRQMIFYHLENTYSVKRQDIPKKPKAFAEGLEKIFGVGALVLEKIIVKTLYSKLGLKYEDKKDFVFIDYLKDFITTKEDQNKSEHFELEEPSSAYSASQLDIAMQQFDLNNLNKI